MMVFLFINGALQAVDGQPQTIPKSNITWIVLGTKPVSSTIVACSYLFVAAYATTWGPVSWCYPAEIFPSKVRAKAVSLAVSANWFWNSVLSSPCRQCCTTPHGRSIWSSAPSTGSR